MRTTEAQRDLLDRVKRGVDRVRETYGRPDHLRLSDADYRTFLTMDDVTVAQFIPGQLEYPRLLGIPVQHNREGLSYLSAMIGGVERMYPMGIGSADLEYWYETSTEPLERRQEAFHRRIEPPRRLFADDLMERSITPHPELV